MTGTYEDEDLFKALTNASTLLLKMGSLSTCSALILSCSRSIRR